MRGIATEPLFVLTLALGKLVSLGATAQGERRVAAIAGGTLEGAALRGEVVSGSDLQLVRSDGVLEVDAAYLVALEGGAQLRIINQGYRHGPAGVLERLARGDDVGADEYFFRTVMRFETGAPEFDWLNRSIAVTTAQRQGGHVLFHAWQLL